MTCRGNNTIAKDPGNTMGMIVIVITISIDPGTDLVVDIVDPEPGLLADKGQVTLTPDTIRMKTQETLPEGVTSMKIMTLAMGDTIEGAARRP